MSLPSGVVSRPPMVSGHPATFGSIARLSAKVAFLLLPFIAHVAAQVPGRAWQYDARESERAILEEKEHQRQLREEMARLTAPDRLRAEAERLGLVPAEGEALSRRIDAPRGAGR